MDYKKLMKTLNKLEVKDLETAIKWEILNSFKGYFYEDKHKTDKKIKFTNEENFEEYLANMETYIRDVLQDYEKYNVELVDKKRVKER